MVTYTTLESLTWDMESDFVEMGRLAFDESQFHETVTFDPDKLVEIARSHVHDAGKVLHIAEDNGVVVGVFAGYKSSFYFSSDILCRDVLWFVRKEYRETGVGLVLLGMFEDWSKSQGTDVIWLSQDSGVDTDKFSRILGKRGYSFVGANYSLGVS